MKIKRKRCFPYVKEGTSVSGLKGIITIEAALTIPVFIFAMLTLISVIEIHCIRVKIQYAMLNAGKEAAVCMVDIPVLDTGKLYSDIVNDIGSERLDHSLISGGASGISCSSSYYSLMTGDINLKVSYNIKLPFPDFTNLNKSVEEVARIRSWTGYYKENNSSEEDEIVYITKHGTVYHTDHNCTYLKPSIHFVPYSDIEGLRNKNGRKYKKCDKCAHGKPVSGVYITENGEKYHYSLKCPGLKRTVYAVKKSEVGGKGGCSKCSH